MNETTTRRSILRTAGVLAALAAFPTAVSAGGTPAKQATNNEWTLVQTPTTNTLYDVAYAADTVYAVGAGGVVVRRTGEDGWETLTEGGNDLFGLDVTDDGGRLWTAGAGGTLSEYDVTTGESTAHTLPDGGGDLVAVAVTGGAGAANVFVADDAGHVYASFENAAPGSWRIHEPNGMPVAAMDFYGDRAGHVVTGPDVFATGDGVRFLPKATITDASAFHGIDSKGPNDVIVCGTKGQIHFLRSDGLAWIGSDLGSASLRDVAVDGTGRESGGLAVGLNGVIFRRHRDRWMRQETPTRRHLYAVVQGGNRNVPGGSPDIAVGAGGTILEYVS